MNIEERLLSSVQDGVRELVADTIEYVADQTESPIETLLGATMIVAMKLQRSSSHFVFCHHDEELAWAHSRFLWMAQYPWRKYRIDWVLRVRGAKQPYIFVECDGHNFHERTKEQAERDRAKDREIQQAGIPILRFTGREIYRDSAECCAQIISFLKRLELIPVERAA